MRPGRQAWRGDREVRPWSMQPSHRPFAGAGLMTAGALGLLAVLALPAASHAAPATVHLPDVLLPEHTLTRVDDINVEGHAVGASGAPVTGVGGSSVAAARDDAFAWDDGMEYPLAAVDPVWRDGGG